VYVDLSVCVCLCICKDICIGLCALVYIGTYIARVRSTCCYTTYRRGHSTVTAITRSLNGVYLNADRKSRTLLLQLDVSADFDTIDQNTLKYRLDLNFGMCIAVAQLILE